MGKRYRKPISIEAAYNIAYKRFTAAEKDLSYLDALCELAGSQEDIEIEIEHIGSIKTVVMLWFRTHNNELNISEASRQLSGPIQIFKDRENGRATLSRVVNSMPGVVRVRRGLYKLEHISH